MGRSISLLTLAAIAWPLALTAQTNPDLARILERLDRLEQEADHLRLPLAWSQMLYTLKQHVRLVRARIADGDALRAQARSDPTPRYPSGPTA